MLKKIKQLWIGLHLMLHSAAHLAVLAEGDSSGFHVQDAGDEVSLSEAAERQRLLPVVVEVSAVRSVQPHVRRCAVVEVMHGPSGHSDTCALVAPVLLHNVKLQGNQKVK